MAGREVGLNDPNSMWKRRSPAMVAVLSLVSTKDQAG
jgi:hypothetical protein